MNAKLIERPTIMTSFGSTKKSKLNIAKVTIDCETRCINGKIAPNTTSFTSD